MLSREREAAAREASEWRVPAVAKSQQLGMTLEGPPKAKAKLGGTAMVSEPKAWAMSPGGGKPPPKGASRRDREEGRHPSQWRLTCT